MATIPSQSQIADHEDDNGDDHPSHCEEYSDEDESSDIDGNFDSPKDSWSTNTHKNERFFTLNNSFSQRKSDGKVYIDIDSCYANQDVKKAQHLPYDIDGNVVYEVPCDTVKRFASTVDGRDWSHRNKSRRAGFAGDRFLATCKGYFQCLNPRCPHIQQFKTPNKVNFTSTGICRSCQVSVADVNGKVTKQPCPARKIWEFGTDKVTVYHFGIHTCTAKTALSKKDAVNHFALHPGARPCEARNDVLGDMIRKGAPLEEVEQTANQFIDRKRLSRVKKAIVGDGYSELAKMKKQIGMLIDN